MDRDTAKPNVNGTFPGNKAKEWVDYHQENAAPSTYVCDFVWDITDEAVGPFCTDPDGNVLLDFTAHVASAPLGYNNPKIMDKLEEFDLVDPAKIAGQDFYLSGGGEPDDPNVPGPSQLMDRFTDITSHYGLDMVFLSNSGAEAVENALKICYDASGGGPHGITFENAFHGRTLGTLSLNRSRAKYRKNFPEISGISEVPYCTDESCNPSTCECGFFTPNESLLKRRLDQNTGALDPSEVSYIILEPIQGEGGYNIPSDVFMDEVQSLSDTHDIPIIADEIQAGVGRTGEWWGSDHFAIEPDVITVAKAGRVGATIASEDTFPDQKGRLSSTWGAGDIVSSIQGVLTVDAIEEHGLLDHAEEQGSAAKELLNDANLPHIEDIRGLGLMLAVEFDTVQNRDKTMEAALQRGLVLLACGEKTIRLLPPLDVTDRELKLGIDIFEKAVNDI